MILGRCCALRSQETLLPPEWYWRLAMIVVGSVGLLATNTMYDKRLINSIRESRAARSSNARAAAADESVHSNMELGALGPPERADEIESAAAGAVTAAASSTHANDAIGAVRASGSEAGCACKCGATRGSSLSTQQHHLSYGQLEESGCCCPEPGASTRGSSRVSSLVDQQSDGGGLSGCPHLRPRRSRVFFDAPRPDARRCCCALYLYVVGLCVWVGIWDLVDYHLLPLLSNTCAAAEAAPGPSQLVHAPACVALKAALVVIGIVGLWGTRSLYGAEQARSAAHQRFN